MSTVRTRFAPSPTGYLHIGGLRTALYAYLLAKQNGGQFILRIEDTDQNRYVEGAVDFVYKTLRLCGLEWDEGPDKGGAYGPYVQTQRREIYQQYARQLVELGGAYYCFCTKEEEEARRARAGEAGAMAHMYDRHCRNLSPAEVEARLAAGDPYVIRQKMPTTGTTSFEDVVYGTITVDNAVLEDGILIKSDGLPTYNFANVIDDHLMAITHVIRGSEYLSSTPKYNLLYQAFGWEIPVYVHVSQILREPGKKLSKRDGDASFEDFYSRGYLKDAILNYIALLGWNPGTDEEFFTLDELVKRFSIDGITKSDAIFDMAKLRWMNGEYIRKLSLEEFHALALPYYQETISRSDVNFLALSRALHPRTEVLGEIPDSIRFIETLPEYDTALFFHKKMKSTAETAATYLPKARSVLAGLATWDESAIHDALLKLAGDEGVKNGVVLWPVRVALSGLESSPGGAIELAAVLGREETLRRIDLAIAKLQSA
ncbi:MAG: glutamate--tRNA ligase [Alicyclobacillus sp.]|nr:glutamate--tRNA ligase [Alicyclobacillus sp.]